MRKLSVLWIVAALMVFVGSGMTNYAFAQSAACLQLQNQLSRISSGGSRRAKPSSKFRQYNRAVNQQRAQISKTRRMAQRNGCGAGFFAKKKSSSCGRINASLGKMQQNLRSLERQRRRLAPRTQGGSSRERRAIIRAMAQRGCRNRGGQKFANARPASRSLVEQIFGVRTFGNDGRRGQFDNPNAAFASRYNTFRTMCVRKKDGYYFPISFSTVRERFEADELACQAKCGGTDVGLYYHAIPAQDSEDMISFRGNIPYAELPTAFSYRKKFDPEASCQYTSGVFQEIAGANGEKSIEQKPKIMHIGKPIYRSDRSLDPESIANDTGDFDAELIASLLNKPSKNDPLVARNSTPKNIRIVGPSFYPVQ